MRKEGFIGRWCSECGEYVPLSKYTSPTKKSTQRRCDDCLESSKQEE